MNLNRKAWNEAQQSLLDALERGEHAVAQGIFSVHHARVHSAQMSGLGVWSFEDEVLDDLDEAAFRRIPPGGEHSIAWNIWHIARIEDVTMNLLLAGAEQVYFAGNWFARLKIPFRHTGNAMSAQEISALSAGIDIEALRGYRVAVGRRTRELVTALDESEYKRRVDESRLARVLAEGALSESAREIAAYWGKRTISGLLLMPATRHNFLHLNECLRLKAKKVL